MFGLILLIILGVVFMGLIVTMCVMKYRGDKEAGPLPWHPAYDQAREERVWREEQAKKRAKTSIEVKGVDIDEVLG